MTVSLKKDIAFNFNIIYFTLRVLKFATPNGIQNHDSNTYKNLVSLKITNTYPYRQISFTVLLDCSIYTVFTFKVLVRNFETTKELFV